MTLCAGTEAMADKINDGGPGAIPVPHDHHLDEDGGLTLRDWFAGQGLPACVSRCHPNEREDGETFAEMYARKAYELADAMLAERAKGPR